jgi:hypothetical protein
MAAARDGASSGVEQVSRDQLWADARQSILVAGGVLAVAAAVVGVFVAHMPSLQVRVVVQQPRWSWWGCVCSATVHSQGGTGR